MTTLWFLTAIAAAPAAHTSLEIAWSSLDGGGISSAAGDAWQLGTTIGQADVGQVAGAGLTLSAGFWNDARPQDVIFGDGFESGDLGAWSQIAAAPSSDLAQSSRPAGSVR